MKKSLLILLLFPLLGFSQQTVGLFNNQQNSLNGYTIVTPLRSTKTYLIDNCGNKVYEWQSNYPSLDAELLNNGELVRSIILPNNSFDFGGTTGGIEILDLNGDQVLEISICTDSLMLHHDFEVLPNGNILVLAVELIDSVDVVNSGSRVYEKRFAETILEIDRESLNIVWEWRSWDHLIQDVSPDYTNYGVVSDYPGRININYYFDESDPDWLHFNSIDFNEDLDQIMVGSPHFNELWIIDHSTTTQEATTSTGGDFNKGGDLLYRWGNPAAYQRGSESDQKFEFQHNCSWIPKGLPNEGKIMIFNNGSDRLFSSVDIINPTLNSNNYLFSDQQTYLPDDTFFSYSDTAKFFSNIVSGAQQLENGNILICSGSQGRIFEIENQTNSVVWDYRLPFTFSGGTPSVMSQGDSITRSLIFRSKKYSPSFDAFNYLDLVTSSPLELNPFPNNCQLFIKGCMDTSMSNFSSDVNTDDGSCISWEALAVDLQAQLNEVVHEDGISQADIDAAYDEGVASVEIPDCEEVIIQNISLDFPQGWSMFGYTCLESVFVINGFFSISDKIEIVKDEWGLAYLPDWGFSAFDNLEFGEGYQIKMKEEVSSFQFCTTITGTN
ncbi:MAG: hypothetical protein CMD29_04235 [Flavobacteriales bacterium]|nr:hypothetical protein [Flavobacteriales bacterium]|tara:strand:- start:939 stop:2768 length:1830 start_codon:yes stop_codon:yes gene_type:complete